MRLPKRWLITSQNQNLTIDGRECVYVVKVRGRLHPRANGKRTSIIYIGMSASKDGPSKRFKHWFKDPYGHSGAYTLYYWAKEMAHILFKNGVYPQRRKDQTRAMWWQKHVADLVEIHAIPLETKGSAKLLEKKLLHKFWAKYGEPPVLNAVVQDKWKPWNELFPVGFRKRAS